MSEKDDKMIELEALEKEYEVILNQYQEALNSYISALNQPTNFVSLKGRAYWGQKGLNQDTANSKEECINMCKNDSKCTGATYNEKQHYCWLRQGNAASTITASNNTDDYAILSQDKVLLTRLNYYNEKLTDMSEQIFKSLRSLKPTLDENKAENTLKQKQIEIHYINLKKQKKDIEKELSEYMAVESEYNSQQLYANQNNVSLRVWLLITCIILLITFKNIMGQQDLPFTVLFWVGILGLLVILSFSLTQPSGFLMWGLVLLYVGLNFLGVVN
jgi:PAN domain